VISKPTSRVTKKMAGQAGIPFLPSCRVKIRPMATDDIVYLPADEEDITPSPRPMHTDEQGHSVQDRASVDEHGKFWKKRCTKSLYGCVAQANVGVNGGTDPFLEHDDANRALMAPICSARLYR